ncbi:MAG TPA: NUDIX domain-containing protein [Bacillus sp. (in: firmicutes)]|uniref:NUDIX domain-containing protein n=1 Tax=Bacillus litorisediminis TaxID=2922713 RepID=UPI001FADEB51|nr:NUDIX domain-containing protein [Bacillus litorisediminis]HWO78315.1 NUDIX domain-containing protein [Bacillus sp. (in: firmicutes)]
MTYHIRVRAGAVIIQNQSILLVEFTNERGVHYNLPGGGVDPHESIRDTVRREAMEEACADVDVGPLAFVYEYAPHLSSYRFGDTHTISFFFESKLKNGSVPKYPDYPDPYQTGVKWIPLSELDHIVLFPNIKKQIIEYSLKKRNIVWISEDELEEAYFKTQPKK